MSGTSIPGANAGMFMSFQTKPSRRSKRPRIDAMTGVWTPSNAANWAL